MAGWRRGRASWVRIDPIDWNMHPLIQGPLERPIDVRLDASGEYLYVLDFGHFEMHAERGVEASAYSGKLWRLRLTRDAR